MGGDENPPRDQFAPGGSGVDGRSVPVPGRPQGPSWESEVLATETTRNGPRQRRLRSWFAPLHRPGLHHSIEPPGPGDLDPGDLHGISLFRETLPGDGAAGSSTSWTNARWSRFSIPSNRPQAADLGDAELLTHRRPGHRGSGSSTTSHSWPSSSISPGEKAARHPCLIGPTRSGIDHRRPGPGGRLPQQVWGLSHSPRVRMTIGELALFLQQGLRYRSQPDRDRDGRLLSRSPLP